MNLLIFGPQGAGKGTQAELLAKDLGIDHISPGELLRQEVSRGSAIGHQIQGILEKGEFVPNAIITRLLENRLSTNGWILDGFPRTIEQAAWLESKFAIDRAILLELSDEEAIERIGGRLECAHGHDFHTRYKPPVKEGICDIDGSPLRRRTDDSPEAIKHRLALYHEDTEPLLAHFSHRLLRIDGHLPIDEVHSAILAALR